MNIKTKLLIALSAILVAAFLATSLLNYSLTRESVREELLNSSLPLTGKNIYSEIHSALMRPILVSSSMANDSFLKHWIMDGEKDIGAITEYLADIRNEYGFLTAFFVSATTDKYYYQDGLQKRINPRDSHDIWFYAFTRTKQDYELSVDNNQTENDKLTIFINFRVEDENGRLLGVAGVGVNMDNAITLLAAARKAYNRNVYLVDQDGLVQVHPDKPLVHRRYITETEGIANVAKGILQKYEQPVNFEYDADGKHILLSTRYIPEFKWHLIVEQDEGQALATARHNLVRTLVIGLGASLLIIILCMGTVTHFQGRLENMAKTDPLTEAANRRALEERFELASYRAERYGAPFSLLIFDLDEFKPINDTYGHIEGDKILKTVAQVVTRLIRPSDLLARWGGDEFLVLLDGDCDDAKTISERIRKTIRESSDIPITVSCGVCQNLINDNLDDMIRRADEAMYRAKAKGGNMVIES